jgi:hypothetical protein
MFPAGFFVLFPSLCTLSVLVSLSGSSCVLPFVFTVQRKQHKYPCPRRDSNPQTQQASGTGIGDAADIMHKYGLKGGGERNPRASRNFLWRIILWLLPSRV